MSSKTKQIAGIFSILILGFALGVLLSPPLMGWIMGRGNPEKRIQSLASSLESKLDLNSDQTLKVINILRAAQQGMRDIHKEVVPRVQANRKRTRAEIRDLLNQDQLSKFDSLIADVEKRMPVNGDLPNPGEGPRGPRRRPPPPF